MEMIQPTFDKDGNLEIIPSPGSSSSDFDFFLGKWKIRNRKLKTRLNKSDDWIEFEATQEVYKVLNGLANVDHFHASFDGAPFEGMTIRLFNPKTKLWSIYWADSNTGALDPPVTGSFENKIGTFYTKDTFQNKEIIMVFRWDATDSNYPIWSQAFSEDNGKSWEWNWHMYMSKTE